MIFLGRTFSERPSHGLFPMQWLEVYISLEVLFFQGELLPARFRSFGSGLLGIFDSISLFISVKLVPTWIRMFSLHGTFYMYALNCCIVAIIFYFYMPETSGKSLEDIEEMFQNTKKTGNNKKYQSKAWFLSLNNW